MEEKRVLESLNDNPLKMAILYICTGDYSVFWKDFYNNFEHYFLPGTEKDYYVFTDAKQIEYEEKENVIKLRIDNQPWPLITLLRFDYFLSIGDRLKEYDYLLFANSNIRCKKTVLEYDFLPNMDAGEEISVVQHPGYAWSDKIDFPYERGKNSLAYIPWNCGEKYVIGALYAGTRAAFLKMSVELSKNIHEDLKNRVIAIFHDESHLNHYIIGKTNVKILGPSYCYPTNTSIPVDEIIGGEDKSRYFSVDKIKKANIGVDKRKNIIEKVINRINTSVIYRKLRVVIDAIMGKAV